MNLAVQQELNSLFSSNTYWPRGGFYNLSSSRRFTSQFCKLAVPGKLLDLGCSKTTPYKPLVEAIGLEWFGSDLYSIEEVASPNYRQVKNDIIPFEDATFQNVMAFHVIEHFTHPEAMFAEIARVLQGGGIFGGSLAFHELEHQSFFHLTWRGISELLKRHGFEIISVTPSAVSGMLQSSQRFFGGVSWIESNNGRRAHLRSALLCNLNWGPFLGATCWECLRRGLFKRFYDPLRDPVTIYFYARKL